MWPLSVGQFQGVLLSVTELPNVLLELALPLSLLELVPGVVVVVQVLGGVFASTAAISPSWCCSPPRTERGWLQLASLDAELLCHKAKPC